MNILVIGSGGREHALVWKLKQSPLVKNLYCAPGNAGTASLAENVSIKPMDVEDIVSFVRRAAIDLTVVGPEQPLVAGLVDSLEERGLRVFGPSKAAAQLEGSKVFAKKFMARHGIPTALFKSLAQHEKADAERFIHTLGGSVVVKADGLAAGKGVLICSTEEEAILALDECFVKRAFGDSGNQVVVEELLEGEEASLFVLTDGERYALLASAQDHKRILDDDGGRNTGGMGAYAPAPIVSSDLLARLEREVIRPTLDGMRSEGISYRGCLFIGLMIGRDGPKVLEFNCRFGDPETQVVLPLVDGDLAEILLSIAERRLDPGSVRLHPSSAVCVVMASKGYPDEFETGKTIHGLERLSGEEGVEVFHAGTKQKLDRLVTSGGRVLGVTAIGPNLEQTIRRSYRAVEKITFDGAYYRSDIGTKGLRHLVTTK